MLNRKSHMNFNLLIPCFKRFSFRKYDGHTNRVRKKATFKGKKEKNFSVSNQHRNSHIVFINFSTKKAIRILSCKKNNYPVKNEFSSGFPKISADFLHCLFIHAPNERSNHQAPFFAEVPDMSRHSARCI